MIHMTSIAFLLTLLILIPAAADANSIQTPEVKPIAIESQGLMFSSDRKPRSGCLLLETRGQSYMLISIGDDDESGSMAEYLTLWFYRQTVRLSGTSCGFPGGIYLMYDFSAIQSVLVGLEPDDWDILTLGNEFNDNVNITSLRIVHNGQTILNWTGSKYVGGLSASRWNLSQEIEFSKKVQCPDNTNGFAHWAIMDLGKDDGTKYSETSPGGWCSEFASWVYRHNGWDTPTGSIASDDLRQFFDVRDRLYSIDEIYNGIYTPVMGDYLSMFNQSHSGIFLGWTDPPGMPSPTSGIITIEGGSVVGLYLRTLADLDHIANVQ